MNELTFYYILAKIVAAYPSPIINNAGYRQTAQPNTFAVITNFSLLSSENYGKTTAHTNKAYYFNRSPNAGVKTQYPAVLLINTNSSINLENGNSVTDFTMIVEDSNSLQNYQPSGSVGQGTNLRTPEQIYNDLQRIGNSIIAEAFNNYILAEITPIPPPITPAPTTYLDWANKNYLDAELLAGRLTYEYKNIDFKAIINPNYRASIRLENGSNTANGTLAVVFELTANLTACDQNVNFDYNFIKANKNLPLIPLICC
jgi:hypothetical protein